jgi:hypothetical protein
VACRRAEVELFLVNAAVTSRALNLVTICWQKEP